MAQKCIMLALACILLTVLPMASTYTISGTVEHGKFKNVDFRTMKVTLNDGQYASFVDYEGKFSIYVARPGIYKLDVQCRFFYFEPVLVEVKEDKSMAFLFNIKSGKGTRLLYPL